MYDFENAAAKDGDKVFDIQGTFRIGHTIYVLSADAETELVNRLGDHEYFLTPFKTEQGFTAKRQHHVTSKQVMDELIQGQKAYENTFLVRTQYADGHKHSLYEPDIHKVILQGTGGSPDTLDHYRPNEFIRKEIISRMSAFVRHLVDVDYKKWEKFLQQSQCLDAKDFIKSMAAWASRNSDKTPRAVRLDIHGGEITVLPNARFKPNLGGGPFMMYR